MVERLYSRLVGEHSRNVGSALVLRDILGHSSDAILHKASLDICQKFIVPSSVWIAPSTRASFLPVAREHSEISIPVLVISVFSHLSLCT
jgi:hypothetical protein